MISSADATVSKRKGEERSQRSVAKKEGTCRSKISLSSGDQVYASPLA